MTEAEWNSCTDPQPMLEFLRGKASDRKLRLFAVACCRRAWHLFDRRETRQAIELSERFADGETNVTDLNEAAWRAATSADFSWFRFVEDWERRAANIASLIAQPLLSAEELIWLCKELPKAIKLNPYTLESWFGWGKAPQAHTRFLQCVFGPLIFRPIVIRPNWLTSAVLALAQAIYTERAFDRMPILADALEDAGCDHVDILAHCRGPGPHAKGCWVVDLLLQKE